MPRPVRMGTHNDEVGFEVPGQTFQVPTGPALPPPIHDSEGPAADPGAAGPVVISGRGATKPQTSEHDDLERWANKILDYIPEAEADLVREVERMSGAPLWHVIAGYIMRCRESGHLHSPIIMEEWGIMQNPRAPKPCGICGTTFTPETWGQLYCSNLCGSKAEREMNRKHYAATSIARV